MERDEGEALKISPQHRDTVPRAVLQPLLSNTGNLSYRSKSPADRKCALSKLSPTLLCRIFTKVIEGNACPFNNGDGDSHSEDYLEHPHVHTAYCYHDFPVTLSHVCKAWYTTLVSEGWFWTNIRLDTGSAYGCTLNWAPRVAAYLQRSRSEPLQIDILAPEGNSLSLPDIERFLDLVLPHVGRWSDFVAYIPGVTVVEVNYLLRRLGSPKCGPALLLEKLHLFFFRGDVLDDPLGRFDLDWELVSGLSRQPFLPFRGRAPMLRDILVAGVNVDWPAAVELLSGEELLELEFSLLPRKRRPDWKAFVDIVTQSPNLETLDLLCSGPNLQLSANGGRICAGMPPVVINMPSLKRLGLRLNPSSYTAALMRRLCLPELIALELELVDDPSELLDVLTETAFVGGGSVLSGLRYLSLERMECIPYDLYSACDNVEELSLNLLHLDPTFFLLPLSWASETGDSKAAFFPRLQSLVLHNVCSGSVICHVVETRKDFGVPLRAVMVDDYSLVHRFTDDDRLSLTGNVTLQSILQYHDSDGTSSKLYCSIDHIHDPLPARPVG